MSATTVDHDANHHHDRMTNDAADRRAMKARRRLSLVASQSMSPGNTSTSSSSMRSPTKGLATLRKLDDEDVRAIFECLHDGKPPPPHLRFAIVPVDTDGMRLSPPSHEFEAGLYVLLRPVKKIKGVLHAPAAPPHLAHLVLTHLPPKTCPWSLSGPQFPAPTAIQQRYCYPKGRPEYSSRKGGALWTMYGHDGKEDTEFRLLHVYFSAKRAVNQGMSIADDDPDLLINMQRPPVKRSKRASPARGGGGGGPSRWLRSPARSARHHHRHDDNAKTSLLWSPTAAAATTRSDYSPPRTTATTNTTSPSSRSSLCGSPTSFELFPSLQHPPPPDTVGERTLMSSPPPSPSSVLHHDDELSSSRTPTPHSDGHFVTPPDGLRRFHPVDLDHHSLRTSPSFGYATPSPFRRRQHQWHPKLGDDDDEEPSLSSTTPPMSTGENKTNSEQSGRPCHLLPSPHTHSMIMDQDDPLELDANTFQEVDAYWNDPFLSILMKPSTDGDTRNKVATRTAAAMTTRTPRAADPSSHPGHSGGGTTASPLSSTPVLRQFVHRLDHLHQTLCDWVGAQAAPDQPVLAHLLASWARSVSQNPLIMHQQQTAAGAGISRSGNATAPSARNDDNDSRETTEDANTVALQRLEASV